MQLSSLAYIGECGMDQRITLHGESGTLEARATFKSAEIRGIRDDENEFHLFPIPDRILEGVDKENPFHVTSQITGVYLFIDSILQDQPITPGFYDGLKTQEMIDAAKESHEMGRWVSP